jgi:1-acyl-sn-glycerol-3-phosphate acyltransferase
MTNNILIPETKQENIIRKYRVVPWLAKLAYFLGDKLIFPWFFRQVKIIGQENIPKDGAVIIAPTHRSRWDALIVPYATGRMTSGRDPYFMVSANEIKGIQGWFIRRLGGFPVNTQRFTLDGLQDSLYYSVNLLSQGNMVVIFPEGNIFRSEEVKPLKRGVAKIALEVIQNYPETEIKILPVSIKYSEPKPSRGSAVSVKIGHPLMVEDYQAISVREDSFRLTADLQASLQTIHDDNFIAS